MWTSYRWGGLLCMFLSVHNSTVVEISKKIFAKNEGTTWDYAGNGWWGDNSQSHKWLILNYVADTNANEIRCDRSYVKYIWKFFEFEFFSSDTKHILISTLAHSAGSRRISNTPKLMILNRHWSLFGQRGTSISRKVYASDDAKLKRFHGQHKKVPAHLGGGGEASSKWI